MSKPKEDPRVEVEAALVAGNLVVRGLAEIAGEAWPPGEPERATPRSNQLRRAAVGAANDCTAGEAVLVCGLSPGERAAVRTGEDAKDRLLGLYGGLCWFEVHKVATAASRRMARPYSEVLDDLYQDAWVLLLHAANRYDRPWVRFHTFATTVIRRGLWEIVCRSRGLGGCGRDFGRDFEDALKAGDGPGMTAVLGETYAGAAEEMADAGIADPLEVFLEAERLGVAAGIDAGRIMRAYNGTADLSVGEEEALGIRRPRRRRRDRAGR